MKMCRVHLSDEESGPLVMDLLVDQDSKPIENHSFAGWWGELDSDDIWPFVLRADGRMDFGSDAEDESERFGKTLILKRPVKQGDPVSVVYQDAEYLFRVKTIQDLSSTLVN